MFLLSIIHYSLFIAFNTAHIAQSVEHFLGKEEVIGSIPIVGSMKKRLLIFKFLTVGCARERTDKNLEKNYGRERNICAD